MPTEPTDNFNKHTNTWKGNLTHIKFRFLVKTKIVTMLTMWYVEPLLGNDHEIYNYTKAISK
jgi:hypothetical protein